MALMDFIKKQFIDVIHWTEDDDSVLVSRYPMQDMEIQYGAQLTVRESQAALFVNEGRVADLFAPGLYTLKTQTLPILTNLQNWDKLFQSPFKSDVYFFSTRLKLDRKWGTPQPVTIRDKDFGIVRLRAFGLYGYRIVDPKLFHTEVSGTREHYTVDDLDGQLRGTMVSCMSELFGESGVAFLDMAANLSEFGTQLKARMEPAFAKFGLALDNFVVESVSLPEELQKVLDQRIGMNMVGDLNKFTQYQTANAIPIAAGNEGGIAGAGAGLGAGIAMGQAMAGAFTQATQAAAPAAAPAAAAPAQSAEDVVALLEKLHGLMEKGILTAEEFAAKKAELLGKLS